MSLITEDGTGLATAESLASVAEATARHAALGNTTWADLTTAQMEEAARRAFTYWSQAYRSRWQGCRINSVQAGDWPRVGVVVDGYYVPSDSVPTDIKNAFIDTMLKAATGELNADLTREVIRKKIGPLETEYAPNSPQAVRYRAIDMALAPYLNGSGVNAKLVRS